MICKNTKIGKFIQKYTKAKTGRHKWMAKSIKFTDLKKSAYTFSSRTTFSLRQNFKEP